MKLLSSEQLEYEADLLEDMTIDYDPCLAAHNVVEDTRYIIDKHPDVTIEDVMALTRALEIYERLAGIKKC